MKKIVLILLSVLSLYALSSFQEVFDKHTMTMLLIEPKSGKIVDANKAALAFYGYEKGELFAKRIQEINLFSKEQVQEEMQRAQEQERNYFLFRHQLADKTIKRVEVRSVPYDFGDETLLLSFVQDLSQERLKQEDLWHYQKTLEETIEYKTQLIMFVTLFALFVLTLLAFIHQSKQKSLRSKLLEAQMIQTQASLEELESFFSVNLDLLCIATLDGVFLKINEAWSDILGYERDEIEGKKFLDFVHPDDLEKTLEAMANLGKGEDVSEFTNRYRCRDGSYRYIEWRSHPKGDHIYAAARDITERKKVEDALIQAKSAAEDALKAKSQFLANMSHEIRTPMNAIIGFGSVLEEMDLKEDQKKMLQKMNSSSKILLKILNDILDYSKIEANKLELEQKCFAISDLISQLEVIFLESAKEKGLAFGFELDPKLPPQVRGDAFRLGQVLINLCSNAMKFTHKGEIKVSVTLLEILEENSCRLLWSVQDSGIGMNKEQMAKLFEPFMQADSSTTRQYGGTGLGLVICKNILEAMGTHLEMQTQEGRGSLFSFELKMELCEETLSRSQEKSKIPMQSTQSLQGLSILLVEDNEINQDVATIMLESAGMKVDIANNGAEGVELFIHNKGRYAAILMDLQMPVMSGYEATQRIREYDKKIPIIALTAAAMVEDKQKVLEAGMDDHLGKPIDKEDLYKILLAHIDLRAQDLEQTPPKAEALSDALRQELRIIEERLRQGVLIEEYKREELYEKLRSKVPQDSLELFKEAIADFEYDAAIAQMQKWER